MNEFIIRKGFISKSASTVQADFTVIGDNTADSFITNGGNSNQFVKGDGSLDTNAYLTSANLNNNTININAGSALTGGGSFTLNQGSDETITINHADTSTQTSSVNAGRTYIQTIELDSNGHVTDISTSTETVTNTDTTYTAGDGINLVGTEFSHEDTSSLASTNNSNRTYIQNIEVDDFGHITGVTTSSETVVNTDTNTTYIAGDGINLVGTEFSHEDTSSLTSTNNTDRTYIQNIEVDDFGHITGVTTGSETVTNTDTTYTAGDGINLVGTEFSHEDTSSLTSTNNSDRTYIQNIEVDTFGHITGVTTSSETVVDTTYAAGDGINLVGTEFSHDDTSSLISTNNTNRTYIQNIEVDDFGHITGVTTSSETVVNTDTDTTYTAGNGIILNNTEFSHDDTSKL